MPWQQLAPRHEETSHTQLPDMQCCPAAHSAPVLPQTHPPFSQRSARRKSHCEQACPSRPQSNKLMAVTQADPEQHPAQEAGHPLAMPPPVAPPPVAPPPAAPPPVAPPPAPALSMHAPNWQPSVTLQTRHMVPNAPQACDVAPGWHVPLMSQQPAPQVEALQMVRVGPQAAPRNPQSAIRRTVMPRRSSHSVPVSSCEDE